MEKKKRIKRKNEITDKEMSLAVRVVNGEITVPEARELAGYASQYGYRLIIALREAVKQNKVKVIATSESMYA